MNSENGFYGPTRQLIDGLNEFLDVAGLERNTGVRAKLAIALCDRLGDRLEGQQLGAINAARDFWLQGKLTDYQKWFDLFSLRAGGPQPLHPIDRLVWGALARSGGLDSFTGEGLVLEAFDAGLTVEDISAAIVDVVPDFSAG